MPVNGHSQAAAGRLGFDDQTHTISLDGRDYRLDGNPKAYHLYKLLAVEIGVPITRKDFRLDPRKLFKGDKAVPTLISRLPRMLRNTIHTGPEGYWISLPIAPEK